VRDTGRTLTTFDFADTAAGAQAPRTAHSTTAGGGAAATQHGAGSEFRGVHRAALLAALRDALPAASTRVGAQVVSVVHTGGGTDAKHISSSSSSSGSSQWPVVQLADGSQLEAGVLIGADGVRSAVATGPGGLGLGPANYAGYTAYRGVCKLDNGLQQLGLPPNTIRQV
jgi:2-polyprenyl-6-methoxyphenol hydroxylase-like FAD-dependent oxidoreductase